MRWGYLEDDFFQAGASGGLCRLDFKNPEYLNFADYLNVSEYSDFTKVSSQRIGEIAFSVVPRILLISRASNFDRVG